MKKLYAASLLLLLPCMAATPAVDKNKTWGAATAPVQIEIFSDFTCPHCKLLHENILQQLIHDYVVTSKVYIIDRAFPLTGPGHEHSREAFAYAVAAARVGKYQAVADALYAQQASWAMSGNVWGAVSSALPAAADQKKVQALVKDPGVLAEVEAEYQEGVAIGVNQTPTLYVTAGGKHYPVAGVQDYRLLKSFIDGLLPK